MKTIRAFTLVLVMAALGCGTKGGGPALTTYPISDLYGLQTKDQFCIDNNLTTTCDGHYLQMFEYELMQYYNKPIASVAICNSNLAFCSGDFDHRLEDHVRLWVVH